MPCGARATEAALSGLVGPGHRRRTRACRTSVHAAVRAHADERAKFRLDRHHSPMEVEDEATAQQPIPARDSYRRKPWLRPVPLVLTLAGLAVASIAALGIYQYVTDVSVYVKNTSDSAIVLRHCGHTDSRLILANATIRFDLSPLHSCPVYDDVATAPVYLGCLSFPATLPGGGQIDYPTNLRPRTPESSCH
jgi:hypothetical protein